MNEFPKRILMTADTVGGVWTYAVELARALEGHEIEVALATMGGALNRDQRRQVRELQNVQVFESGFRLEWMNDPWTDVALAAEWLLDIDRAVHPDLVHLNNFAHGALPWSAPTIVVGHSCVLSWWHAVRRGPITAQWKRYALEVTKGLQNADMVVAPCRAMLDQLEMFYGPFQSERVIYNARRRELFQPCEKEPIVFSAGRIWDEAKNISTLLTVAPALDWPVYVAGDCSHPDDGHESKTGERFRNAFMLERIGQREIAYWMGRASIYAAPVVYEPFGLSILEAALAGCALVLSDIPSLREIWGDAATFVPAHDKKAWKNAINGLIELPVKRKETAALAHCRALQFNLHQFGSDYLRAYCDVLARREEQSTERICADQDVLSHAVV
jgi:glycogen(starch) synthase